MEFQKTRTVETKSFNLGMNKDIDPQLLTDGQYTHAINSKKFSKDGNFFGIRNEEGTKFCIDLPYTYNGNIPLLDNKFVIFSTDDIHSEIGIYDENTCSYKKIVNSSCLNFNRKHIVRGVSKQNNDCSESIYWCNNYNNNRTLNLNNIPYKYTFADDECKTKIFSDDLDCEQLELNNLIRIPCLNIKKSNKTGNLLNGSYQAVITYSIKEQTVSDFYGVTKPISIFSHGDIGGAVDIELNNLDLDFPEFNLHLIVTVAQQTTVYKVGTYSTTQSNVTVTTIRPTDIIIPLSSVYLQKIVNSKSENVIAVNNQLIWSFPTTKSELDYQNLANNIRAEWVAYAVPIDEHNSDIQSYMRDEIYSLGIGYNYTDGSKTSVYPLIGRKATAKELEIINTEDAFELFLKNCDKKTDLKRWQVYNTATGFVSLNPIDKCEYKIIGRGEFGYYESLEKYPDNINNFGELACTPIRLFRFPDDSLVPRTLKNSSGVVTHVIHLGVSLTNIQHPEDIDGNKLTNIQGYEIFRADRTTDKSIIGKGLLFNMGQYDMLTTSKDKTPALYPNYPFNDLNTDQFLSKTQTKGSNFKEKDYTPMGSFSSLYYTIHSPSFSFNKPSFGNELKIEGIESGSSKSYFEPVYNHPKNKLLTDIAFITSTLLGIGEAYVATREETIITTITESKEIELPMVVGTGGVVTGSATAYTAALTAYLAAVKVCELGGLNPFGGTVDACKQTAYTTFLTSIAPLVAAGGAKVSHSQTEDNSAIGGIPKLLRILNDVFLFSFYFQQGVNTGLNTLRSFSKPQQYAYQVNSYCYYNNFKPSNDNSKRRYIEDINYLYPTMQQFGNITVNNFKRESSVVLKLSRPLHFPSVKDNSRQTMSQAGACDSKSYSATASSYYVSIKQRQESQYGQLQNIKWLSTGTCSFFENPSKPNNFYNNELILGGDTFIGRFTVKRKMHYFNQVAFGENDNFEFDYRKYANIQYPRYWMDTEEYDLSELVSFKPVLPNDKSHLDCKKTSDKIKDKLKSAFIVTDKHFYLYNNGVIDFYVESEINLSNRDWEEQPFYRHYDSEKYSDLSQLFRSDYLDYDNRYIYDKSYSKQLEESIGFTQDIYFDKELANTCAIKHPNRVFYSLPNNKDLIKDNWRSYLANNYYDFPLDNGNLTGMKALDRTNIAFFFDNSAPYIHQAIDQLETDSGLKVQIGDGGLFVRQPQPILTTDVKYGNSNTKFGYTNSQFGIFYPSVTNGRVFLLQGTSLKEVSRNGLRFWFQNNMEFNTLKQFPNFIDVDNTITGVGYISTFDNTEETFYLIKKDYSVREEFKDTLFYDEIKNNFYLKRGNGFKRNIAFKDPLYFEDASWTVSYSPNDESWISFHDWQPNAIIQTENHFVGVTIPTLKNKCSLWKHNEICTNYCKYYNKQYTWDVEYVNSNGQNTSILSSVEYILESYIYDNNCNTKHHLLDYNFNKAYVYNTEQQSGLLKLNLATKNQISKILLYPKINSDSIDIEYHKEEQKFRFNQFWDVCDNRAEFNTNYVSTHIYQVNGYRYAPNPEYIDYTKPPFERKRLRHNWHKIYLSRENQQDELMPHMILKFVNNKSLISSR